MYAAALRKNPTQTSYPSEVFERWFLQKQQKIFDKITKSWNKKSIKRLEHDCPKQVNDFNSWLLPATTITPRIILCSWSVICPTSSISQNWKSAKRLNHLKDSMTYILTKHFTIQRLQLWMLHYTVIQNLCFELCTVKCGLVSDWVTRSNPNFFIGFSKISIFPAAIIIQVFHFFILEIAKNLANFCSCCNVFTLYISGKNVGILTVIQTSTVPHNSCKFLVHQYACFVSFSYSRRRNKYPWTFPSVEIPTSLKTFITASSTCSVMEDIPLQKLAERWKAERFLRQGKRVVQPLTNQIWIWFAANHVTVAWAFATLCPYCCCSIM